ncbi:hypothetical protein AMTRI_Chr02g263260 [Amborella trichopoda]
MAAIKRKRNAATTTPSEKEKKNKNNIAKPSAKQRLKTGGGDGTKLRDSKTTQSQGYDAKTNQAPPKKSASRLSKEMAEARKKKRKRHYSLQQELALLWEKMRRHDISKEERSKLISDALQKMKGKIPEIAGSHVSSRVLQTCVKYCQPSERNSVYEELRPHFIGLARNTYAVHLLKKMLDNADKKQLQAFISSLQGHVAPLLRHLVGSAVVEHAFNLANGAQKQSLLLEIYSSEFQLFKSMISTKEGRLQDLISKLSLKKSSVLERMSSVLQPVLKKGLVDHSILHKVLLEYLSIANKSSATDVILQLSGPLLVRMIHTRDGSKVGSLCVKHGSAKERKKIVKVMKGHVQKVAHDQYGSMVLACILSLVDDTKILTKVVIRELQTNLKDLILDKNGRRPILQLLHPKSQRYCGVDGLAVLNESIPSLSNVGCEQSDGVSNGSSIGNEALNAPKVTDEETHDSGTSGTIQHAVEKGTKAPSKRRFELLVDSGLAQSLVDTCIASCGELLRSNFGKDVLYEVATGAAGGVLWEPLADSLTALHEAIANLGALPKFGSPEEEHIFENFHSSRTIRKLVMDCPSFAQVLWKLALVGKCNMWAQGHSGKVIYAFLECSDPEIRDMVKPELEPLIDAGTLKIPDKQLEQ